MKYMRLGSKPDIFSTEGNFRTVATEMESDVTLQVEDKLFHLHKFPLLSKCSRFKRLMAEARDDDVVKIKDIPGGVHAFEVCAKFCYGVVVTLNAHNVISVRCAADYLGMTEDIDRGNLIFKLEVFLNSSIFRKWKDSIICLKTTKSVIPWSQDLKLVSRCVDAIASKTSVDPSKVDWSFMYRCSKQVNGLVNCESSSSSEHITNVPKDWWVEDISELEIDLYWRVMIAIKSKGRMPDVLIGKALQAYACRWIPGLFKDQLVHAACDDYKQTSDKHKLIVETVVGLLPAEKGACSCCFLLRLLKVATLLNLESSCKVELARRIGMQLDEASLNDLLIPSLSYANDTLYDVDLVQQLVDHFMMQDGSLSPCSPVRGHHRNYEKRRSRSADQLDVIDSTEPVSHSSKLQVAKLLDGYLTEIARDRSLPPSKFIALAESIPDYTRPVHDGLYRAIDVYLKEHPELLKGEKQRICKLLDCKKLSMDACSHAAQNERLPVRVVVQVLFFEQLRTATTGGLVLQDLPSNIQALLPRTQSLVERHQQGTPQASLAMDWESVNGEFDALKHDMADMRRKIDEAEAQRGRCRSQKDAFSFSLFRGRTVLFSSKRVLSRLLSVRSRSLGSRQSEISNSSGSPVSSGAPLKGFVGSNALMRQRSNSMS